MINITGRSTDCNPVATIRCFASVMSKSENDYKQAVADAEAQYGADSIMIGDALIDLARFYERFGLWDAANDCDLRIHGILEKYLQT